VTVTSGSVSDTWLQAGPGEVSHPGNGNALKATAPKSRRFQPESEDDLRRSPAAPNMTPPSNAKLAVAKLRSLMAPWWQMESGTLCNASAIDTRAACSMEGHALLAATSFGLELNSDERIKIIWMRSET